MIAIVREQVIARAEKLLRDLFYNSLNLLLCSESESLQYCAPPCATRRLKVRFGPVDTCDASPIVATVGELSAIYYDAGVEEGAADCPEEG